MTRSAPQCAVGFDFDHKLAIDNKLERVALLRLLLSFPREELTLAQETERIDELLKQQRSGAFSIDAAVERYARAHGANQGFSVHIERFKTFALEGVEDFVIPLPGLHEMLDALACAKVPVAILSNGWSPLQQRKAEYVGFNGAVIASDQIGAQKPDAKAFEALLKTLRTAASETWYVGDNPAIDVAGSINAGLRAIWLDEGAPYPQDLPEASARVTDLRELPATVCP
jgi:HAD superfamily hydrolase (TIGR01549 family)